MGKRNWKNVQARDLRHAQELCIEHARDKFNDSVDRIAEKMQITNKWVLYKWMEAGNLPVRLITKFEAACGIDFISRYLVMSQNKLVIDIPRGTKVDVQDIQALQAVTHASIGAIIDFYANKSDAVDTMLAIQTALEQLAYHRGNIEKQRQPELPFGEE
jgi:hypothetical protein